MMRIICSFILVFLSGTCFADCDDAYRKCRNECSSASVYDYQNNKYLYSGQSDFNSKCEDACRRGRRYCEGESNLSDGCDEFKRKCRNDCPSSIYIYGKGYVYSSDASSKCDSACYSGYRRCE